MPKKEKVAPDLAGEAQTVAAPDGAKPETVQPEVVEAPKPSLARNAAASAPRNSAAEQAAFDETVADMKAFLKSQPKVRILIPLEQGERIVPGKEVPFLPVNINGYRLNVPKGSYQDVPQLVADIISESLQIYEHNSASGMRADASDPSKAAALNL